MLNLLLLLAVPTSCVPKGEFVVYDPSLGNVNEKCCPGLKETKVNDLFGVCQ